MDKIEVKIAGSKAKSVPVPIKEGEEYTGIEVEMARHPNGSVQVNRATAVSRQHLQEQSRE